jgi:hypothetical protein
MENVDVFPGERRRKRQARVVAKAKVDGSAVIGPKKDGAGGTERGRVEALALRAGGGGVGRPAAGGIQ